MIPPAPGTQRSYRQKDQMTKNLPPTSSSVMALCGALYVLGALRKAPGTNYWAVNTSKTEIRVSSKSHPLPCCNRPPYSLRRSSYGCASPPRGMKDSRNLDPTLR